MPMLWHFIIVIVVIIIIIISIIMIIIIIMLQMYCFMVTRLDQTVDSGALFEGH